MTLGINFDLLSDSQYDSFINVYMPKYGNPDNDTTEVTRNIWFNHKPFIGDHEVGFGATVFGSDCMALHVGSFSAGYYNSSYGKYSFTCGCGNSAGYSSFASGKNNTIYGDSSFGTGYKNILRGDRSFVGGSNNTVMGDCCFTYGTHLTNTHGTTLQLGFYNNDDNSNCCPDKYLIISSFILFLLTASKISSILWAII